MDTNRRLIQQYSGEGARDYDNRRQHSSRFKREVEVFSQLTTGVQASCVIDAPIGTGRWVETYHERGWRVVGVDLSADMLKQASRKVQSVGSQKIQLVRGNLLDAKFTAGLNERFDLAICIRFMNWVPTDQAFTAVRNLEATGARQMILGVSFLRGTLSAWKRLSSRTHLGWINLRRRLNGQPPQYVHDERRFTAFLKESGWQTVRKEHIFSRDSRDNYFFLLVK